MTGETTTKVTCPLCKSLVDPHGDLAEHLPPDFDGLGVPFACSVHEGFGLPVVTPGEWQASLNGVPVAHCVAFDRRKGELWHYATGADGNFLRVGDSLHVEKRTGLVTVQPIGGAA